MGFIPNKPRPNSYICNRGGKYGFIPPKRTEGKWKLVEVDGETLLELRYYEIEKGKSFQLSRTVRYLVVHLEEDLMELTMINGANAL